MERGLPFAFLTLRALGGMAAASGDNWTASLGAFGNVVTTENNDDEGKSVAARITYAPFFQSDRVLYLGFSGAWREPQQRAPDTVSRAGASATSRPASTGIRTHTSAS